MAQLSCTLRPLQRTATARVLCGLFRVHNNFYLPPVSLFRRKCLRGTVCYKYELHVQFPGIRHANQKMRSSYHLSHFAYININVIPRSPSQPSEQPTDHNFAPTLCQYPLPPTRSPPHVCKTRSLTAKRYFELPTILHLCKVKIFSAVGEFHFHNFCVTFTLRHTLKNVGHFSETNKETNGCKIAFLYATFIFMSSVCESKWMLTVWHRKKDIPSAFVA